MQSARTKVVDRSDSSTELTYELRLWDREGALKLYTDHQLDSSHSETSEGG